jgi:uncharacterized iron-regulated membrane protein
VKLQTLFRKVHHWGSIIIALPLVIMIGAGSLLMLKKEFEWIQPPSQKGIAHSEVPMASMQSLFDAALSVEKAGFTTWEVQVDTHSAKVLQVAERRSDVIEAIHDGSYFAEWVKLWVFLPAGLILFVLWITGLYLFVQTEIKKWSNRRRTAIRHSG